MDHADKVILGVVGIGAVAGIGWYLYEKSKNASSNQSVVQSIPYGTGSTSSSYPSSGTTSSTSSSSSTGSNQTVTYTIPSSSTSGSSSQTSTFNPGSSVTASQQASGLSGALQPGIKGTYPTLGDPGWESGDKWYPTINQAPSGAVPAYEVDSYYDQFVQTVSY